jgi:hypothetical protein
MRRFSTWFYENGLVLALIVWAAAIGLMGIRLEDRVWGWVFIGVSIVGGLTVGAIYWIRKWVASVSKDGPAAVTPKE